MAALSTTSSDDILPGLRTLEAVAGREQRQAHALQATYLAVLMLAPLAHLLPLPDTVRGAVEDRISGVFLLVAVALRIVMRHVAAESDWVQARRRVEEAQSAAWRRAATAAPAPGDGPLLLEIASSGLAARWRTYRERRIDDQVAFFTRRVSEYARAARRWRLLRVVLTVATLAAATVTVVRSHPISPAVTGVLSVTLATTEAWIQFRRQQVIAESYAGARAELCTLREQEPADDAGLAAVVDAVELALERERWTWSAIMAVAVLTSARTAAQPEG